jgi:hypothetical protein
MDARSEAALILPARSRRVKCGFARVPAPDCWSTTLKFLIGLFVGLLAGASLSLFYANLVRDQGAYPRGVMAAMQHHYDTLRRGIADPACPPAASRPALLRLRAVSDEVVPAFIDARQPGPDFARRHQGLVDALDAALAEPPADCQALNALVRDLGDRCDGCHLEFK